MEYKKIGMIVVLVLAVCEAVKRAGLQSKFVPLLAVVLGLLGAFWFDGVNFLATASGVVLGLATTGGYTLVKKLSE